MTVEHFTQRSVIVSLLHLAVCASALSLHSQSPAQALLKPNENKKARDSTYWMRLANLGDVQYTGLLRVGGQQLKAIVDTGSFEMLVFGVDCTICGESDNLYNGSKSEDYAPTTFPGSHTFGSGTTKSVEVVDSVQIGSLSIPKQVFWEVKDADMPILSDDSFQVILGVGPPQSVLKFAQKEDGQVHRELHQLEKKGKHVTTDVKKIVEHYDDEVVHAQNTTTVAEGIELDSMAICLSKESGTDGYFIWNDDRAEKEAEKFVRLDVAGDIYWSLNLSHVSFGEAPGVPENASLAMKKAAKPKAIGCWSTGCSAVIDTGTSLIVAPSTMADQIFENMQDWVLAGGTCDDLSNLPDINLKLNGHKFSLPPEAYVGQVEGEFDQDLRAHMPQLTAKRRKLFQNIGCEPLIMTMDSESQFGPLWIIGMPFFRKYFTNFEFVRHIGKLSVPIATSMSFSEADSNCRPHRSPDENTTVTERSSGRGVQLKVDASKIRISTLQLQSLEHRRSNLLGVHRVTI